MRMRLKKYLNERVDAAKDKAADVVDAAKDKAADMVEGAKDAAKDAAGSMVGDKYK